MKTKTWVYLIIAASLFVNSQCKKDKNDTLIKAGYNVVDVDGNVYHTLIIGSQVWMVENLKTTKYNDATVIPFISEKSAWSDLQTSGSCYYNNTKTDHITEELQGCVDVFRYISNYEDREVYEKIRSDEIDILID